MKFVELPKKKNDYGVPDGWVPVSAYAKGTEVVIELLPSDEGFDDSLHDCDVEGCGTLFHVVRFDVQQKYLGDGLSNEKTNLAGEQEQSPDVTDVSRKVFPTDDEIGRIVERIAYKQLAEEQADDFIEKVWELKYFLDNHFG